MGRGNLRGRGRRLFCGDGGIGYNQNTNYHPQQAHSHPEMEDSQQIRGICTFPDIDPPHGPSGQSHATASVNPQALS